MISFTFLAVSAFILMILMNLLKKNPSVVTAFQIASLLVAAALMSLGLKEGAYGLMVAGALSLIVKAIVAPTFLRNRINRYNGYFSASAYTRIPLTLTILAVLTGFAHFIITSAVPSADPTIAALLLASIFGMCFFMVNRTGTLAQTIGILGIENNIVLLTVFLGLEHSIALEIAIAFDILVWVGIAATFLTLIYRQFGSLEGAPMTHLRED